MDTGRKTFVVFLSLVMALVAGCKKSAPPGPDLDASPQTRAPLRPKDESLSRLHWLGKKRITAQTNAAPVMAIWNLPESAKLQAQTLDKLSTAPWRLLRGETNAANPAGARLRPLLEDVVQEESYAEVRPAADQSAQIVFAIRLDDRRAALWETNLAATVESLTSIRTMPATNGQRGWALKKHHAPNLIQLTRVGEWTVVGAGQEQNALFDETVARIQRGHAPFAARATNDWLEADLDLPRVAGTLWHAWNLPGDLPRLSVRVTGDGGNVLTVGDLTFPKPLQLELDTWNIPANLIRQPLASFTAIRGIKPWLASWKIWNDFQIGPPPNQLYFWALEDFPIQTYFAALTPDASNQVHGLTGILLRNLNPWLAARDEGGFKQSQDTNGVAWEGNPFMSPFMRFAAAGRAGFVFGGLLPDAGDGTNQAPTAALLQEVLGRTNLVCYNWEVTGPRIEAWVFLGQLFRVVSHTAQLPGQSAGLLWLRAIVPRSGNCVTEVTRAGVNQISLVRKSTVGFTAVELHLLTDWLESPQFPRGLHTFRAPPDDPAAAPAKP